MRHIVGRSTLTELFAGVHLPSGAKITGIEITGCDDNATSDLTASLVRMPGPARVRARRL